MQNENERQIYYISIDYDKMCDQFYDSRKAAVLNKTEKSINLFYPRKNW